MDTQQIFEADYLRMNILIFPSWYPTDNAPLGGIFVKEQALAFAELNPNYNIIVGAWDNGYCQLTPRKPISAIRGLIKLLVEQIEDKTILDNFYEFYTPAPLLWSSRLPFGGFERLYRNFKQTFLRAEEKFDKIDIIHAHVSYPAGYLAGRLAREFNIAFVLTEHMSPFPFNNYTHNGKPRIEIEKAFNSAIQSIAVSNVLQKHIQSFGYPCQNVVANFIDETKFGISNDKAEKFTFFTLGGISEQKGIDTLIKTISLLSPAFRENLEFLIGGSGPRLGYYKQLAKQFSIKNIRWLGQVSRQDAPKLFQSSHAYIMLSRHESFGIVYAEAIASGIPVIATRCGGSEDIINNINGLFVEVDSPEQAAIAIEKIYHNYSRYSSQIIREDFEKRFSKRIFVGKLRKVYLKARCGN